jgi:hypothetical protein
MAITIIQQPPEIIATYSDIVMSVSSNMVISRFKFKYVYDIFSATPAGPAALTTYQYIGRVKQTPNPNGYGLLDLSRYLQLQLSGNTYNGYAANLTQPSGNPLAFSDWNTFGYGKYYIMCGEEYATTLTGNVALYNGDGTLVSGTTLTGVQTITGTTYNGANQFEDGYNPNMTEFFMTSGRTLATNAPRTQYREQDENITFGGFMGFYSGMTTGFTNAGFDCDLLYTIYPTSGGTVTGDIQGITVTATTGDTISMWYGSINLNQLVSGYTNNWNKIDIRFGASSGTTYPAYTETFTYFNKGCPWDKYDPKDIIFLNRYGIWETFRFYGSKEEQLKIQRGTFQRSYGTWSASNFTYRKTERGTSNIRTDLTFEGEVMSDFIDKETVNWLGELLTSPSVFISENNTMVPINITDSSFKRQLRGNAKLRQVSFKYEKSNQVRTQQQA